MARVAKRIELERKQQKEHEADRAAMLQRAVKGLSPLVEVVLMTPRQQVEVLTDYCNRLEVLRDDLRVEFGDLREFASAVRRLDLEIKLTLDEIVKAKIKLEAGVLM